MSDVTQYETVKLEDRAAVRRVHQAIADMLNARIEAGNLESVVVLMVNKAKDDTINGANRFFVQTAHMDLIEDAFVDVIKYLVMQNGVTPADVRADRLQALERAKAAKAALAAPAIPQPTVATWKCGSCGAEVVAAPGSADEHAKVCPGAPA